MEKYDFGSPDEELDEERAEIALNPEYEQEEDTEEWTEDDIEIIEQFDEHYSTMTSHWEPIYKEMEDDWNMYKLDQWTEEAKRARGRRPKLTQDIIRKFVKSVVAETFRNPPGVKLTARNEGSSKKAKYISEAIRYFEARTGAIYAYSFAKESAAVCGIGWLKVTYRYDEQQAMPAVIDIDRVNDPLSVMIDPDARELDGSDALFAVELHGKTDGKEKFTYWWKDKEDQVKWAIICNGAIEEKGIFPTTDIPLIPVYGEIYNIRNKMTCFGIIRQLKDTQRAYNYTFSEGIERLALTPKSPIIAHQGSIPKPYVNDWQRSMTEPVPLLFWNAKDENGNPTLPEPHRGDSNPDTAWIGPMIQQLQMTANETTGIYPDSYGAQNSAESGIAIKARMEGADRGQLVYDEHLNLSIKQVGLIMLDLLEPVVTPSGILPIMGEDGEVGMKNIGMGEPMIDPNTGMQMLDQYTGMPMMMEPELPDLDVTDLEINVSAAPAYATRKQEGIDKITEILPMLPPEQASMLIPQIIRSMDFPGAEEYANILAPAQDAGPDPMALQQQLSEAQAQMEQMNQALTEMQNQNMQLNMQLSQNTQAMMAKAQLDSQTKLAVEQMKQEGIMVKTQMQIQADAEADNKGIMSDMNQQQNDMQLELAKIANETERDNAELALKAQQQQIDVLSAVTTEVMPQYPR